MRGQERYVIRGEASRIALDYLKNDSDVAKFILVFLEMKSFQGRKTYFKIADFKQRSLLGGYPLNLIIRKMKKEGILEVKDKRASFTDKGLDMFYDILKGTLLA